MGLAILNDPDDIDRAGRSPAYVRTILELRCDAETDGLFPPARAIFRHPDGFVGSYSAAMKAGWLERHDPKRGRLFLCPDCSGKKVP